MEIHVVLDNIRSVFNVGSIFRTSDGVGYVKKIYLCGMTSPIDNPKLEKTALGSLDSVESQHYDTTREALEEIKKQGIPIWAVELSHDAENFQKVEYPEKVALILGHEKEGVKEDILSMCEKKIYIPMRGRKKSLNVANAASIVLYEATRNQE